MDERQHKLGDIKLVKGINNAIAYIEKIHG